VDAWSITTLKTAVTENDDIKDTVVYAYVASIKNDKKGVLLFVDCIQYYSNEEAIAKAKERGDADTLYKNGKMIVSIPGDYYIVNARKKIRTFYLSKRVRYNLQLNEDRQHPISENTLNSFIKIHKDSPFILHISGNEINGIDEVLLP
jgi:hypothetical protein